MRFARFLTVGLFNTALGGACIFVAMRWLRLDYRIANCFGYSAGFVLSFLLNRTWTFGDKGSLSASALRWVVVVALCFLLNLATAVFLREWWHVDALFAQLGGIAVYSLASFAGARFFAFRGVAGIPSLQHR